MKKLIAAIIGLTAITQVYAQEEFIIMNMVMNADSHKQEEEEKKQEVNNLTISRNESYLSTVIKIKTALNGYVQNVSAKRQISLDNVQIKDFINTLYVQDKTMIRGDNLFMKDRMEISVEQSKDKYILLVIKNVSEQQAKIISNAFSNNVYTSHVVNDEIDRKITLSVF